jgi:hypothetical protein
MNDKTPIKEIYIDMLNRIRNNNLNEAYVKSLVKILFKDDKNILNQLTVIEKSLDLNQDGTTDYKDLIYLREHFFNFEIILYLIISLVQISKLILLLKPSLLPVNDVIDIICITLIYIVIKLPILTNNIIVFIESNGYVMIDIIIYLRELMQKNDYIVYIINSSIKDLTKIFICCNAGTADNDYKITLKKAAAEISIRTKNINKIIKK